MEKRERYGLLQGFEWRRDSDVVYYGFANGVETAIWSTAGFANGEERAIWSAAGFRTKKGQRYGLMQYF